MDNIKIRTCTQVLQPHLFFEVTVGKVCQHTQHTWWESPSAEEATFPTKAEQETLMEVNGW